MTEQTQNEAALMLDYLTACLPGGTFFGESAMPSGTYKPAAGAAHCTLIRGGSFVDDARVLKTISLQVKTFGVDTPTALTAELALHNALRITSKVLAFEQETVPQSLTEPNTGMPDWTYVLSFYSFLIRTT